MNSRFRFGGVWSVLLALLVSAHAAEGAVRLPALFSEGMVLQRDTAVPIWGWADPGEKITVTLGEKTVEATAAPDGRWKAELPASPAGGPHQIVVQGKDQKAAIGNVMFGEVWLASGQSNMHWTFAPNHTVDNNQQELDAANDPLVRQFTVAKKGAPQPADDAAGVWRTATRENLLADAENGASALAYFFARELRQKLDVPVAVINASVGGTPIQAWSPEGNLYNAMIHPLAPYAIRGAIWYQGESNCMGLAGMKYADLQRAMVGAWRALWGRGDFAFYYVQIAPFLYTNPSRPQITVRTLPEFWEAQTAAMDVPQSGMVVVNDITGNVRDIHPRNKQDVAKRLALWALAKDYGQKDLVYSGPLYKEMKIEGDKIRVVFEHTGSGLATRDGNAPSHLEIAGEDRQFQPAAGTLDGHTLVVHSEKVSNPVAVRYAWTEDALPNLMNKEGLPAGPFRTDKW
ncbi:MAG: sialate O-acetylesterase [Pirellulales bacterium]|nr:sialate O-acetylesterase [Pirellulales bacterium]